jgi:hypothetical protein
MIILHRQRTTRLLRSLDCDCMSKRSYHSVDKSNDLLPQPRIRTRCCPRIGLRTACSQDQRRSLLARTLAFRGLASDVVMAEVDIVTISFSGGHGAISILWQSESQHVTTAMEQSLRSATVGHATRLIFVLLPVTVLGDVR